MFTFVDAPLLYVSREISRLNDFYAHHATQIDACLPGSGLPPSPLAERSLIVNASIYYLTVIAKTLLHDSFTANIFQFTLFLITVACFLATCYYVKPLLALITCLWSILFWFMRLFSLAVQDVIQVFRGAVQNQAPSSQHEIREIIPEKDTPPSTYLVPQSSDGMKSFSAAKQHPTASNPEEENLIRDWEKSRLDLARSVMP